jgi:hypothetical protein
MKRNEIVKSLLKEGFSEKTLLNFSDKQLNDLAVRIFLGEMLNIPLGDKPAIEAAKKNQQPFMTFEREVGEELKGNQKKIDANKNGKIDPEDFKLLKSKKDSKKTEKKEVKEWVNRLAENNFHSFTSKNEIMELIKTKINEVEVGPNVKKGHNGIPEFMSYEAITKPSPTKPKVDPGTKPRTPYSPKPGEKSKPKALKEKKDANK